MSQVQRRKTRVGREKGVHTQEARGTGKARPAKLESPCPTPEALIGIQLRQVEVEQIDEQTPVLIGDDISQINDGPQQEAEGVHNEGVTSNSQKPELPQWPPPGGT